jgi:hypothetical protein
MGIVPIHAFFYTIRIYILGMIVLGKTWLSPLGLGDKPSFSNEGLIV